MFEFLPVIDLKGKTSAQKIDELEQYLKRFRTELEDILGNISTENLSPALLNRIETLENTVKAESKKRDEEISQLASKGGV